MLRRNGIVVALYLMAIAILGVLVGMAARPFFQTLIKYYILID
jgi:hypothetical protein